MSDAPKRVHLVSHLSDGREGGRSSCRHSSRPGRRVILKSLADFRSTPVSLRCIECDAALRERLNAAAIGAAS